MTTETIDDIPVAPPEPDDPVPAEDPDEAKTDAPDPDSDDGTEVEPVEDKP